jgi:uncharacterized protein YkwD
MLAAGSAFAQDGEGLVSLINDYRSEARTCEGGQAPAAGPLAPDAALSRIRADAGGELQDALKAVGYQAARVEAITVTGPQDAAATMKLIGQRFCGSLMNPAYADIGVSRDGNTWRLLLARPLLAPDLVDWESAGKTILELSNAARAEPRRCGNKRMAAAPPLSWAPELGQASLAHSRDMADKNYFSHRSPSGSHVGERVERQGYKGRKVGENIAAGQGSPGQAVSAWLSSPSHCASLMSGDFSEMGAAYAVNPDSDGTIYWTQALGSRR